MNLPIKCFYITGNGTEFSYFNGNEISLGCDDRECQTKQYNLYQVLLGVDWIDFDVIVQTNASTILNIVELYKFLTIEYQKEYLYCGSIVNWWHVNGSIDYPNGNLYVYSKDYLRLFFDKWFESIESIKNNYKDMDIENKNQNELMWTGVSEDFIIGYIMKNNNIEIKRIDNVLNFRSTISDNVDFMKPNIYDYLAIYAKTQMANIEMRQQIEPNIIELFALIFERHYL